MNLFLPIKTWKKYLGGNPRGGQSSWNLKIVLENVVLIRPYSELLPQTQITYNMNTLTYRDVVNSFIAACICIKEFGFKYYMYN